MSQTRLNGDDADIERETVREGEYREASYTIVRTNVPRYTNGFKYEFVLSVEGHEVTTASELETRGYVNPWIPAMETYVRAYIDGAKAQWDSRESSVY